MQAENIPSRMLGGARFFERKEVKDILAYLTLADNPLFTPALERVINVPKRAIGDKALSDLKELAHSKGVRTMEIVEEAAEASKPIMGIKPGVQKSLKSFFEVIKEIRKQALSVSEKLGLHIAERSLTLLFVPLAHSRCHHY